MKLSGVVRNYRANELPAAAPAPYPIVNNLMRICIAVIIFMIKIYISYNQSLVTNDTI